MDKKRAKQELRKVILMRLSGESELYTEEYNTCLNRVEARKRIESRRSINIKTRA